ncbi:hypothetical protein Vi06_02 [Salmonella phage Vi06]|uniref:Uncharacterized protein n=1 Tax=Salmonella phage Vi06 TaxID=866889 RepID=E1XU81_9CAUD|nr:hypothetical protein Vi06_02 [Salmonella phage Vi06]CBV65200.1 hypothetical protein Vi06_02 [Salmonella phage Vi06]
MLRCVVGSIGRSQCDTLRHCMKTARVSTIAINTLRINFMKCTTLFFNYSKNGACDMTTPDLLNGRTWMIDSPTIVTIAIAVYILYRWGKRYEWSKLYHWCKQYKVEYKRCRREGSKLKTFGDNLGKLLGVIVGSYLAFSSDAVMTAELFAAYFFIPVAVGCAIDCSWTHRKGTKGNT